MWRYLVASFASDLSRIAVASCQITRNARICVLLLSEMMLQTPTAEFELQCIRSKVSKAIFWWISAEAYLYFLQKNNNEKKRVSTRTCFKTKYAEARITIIPSISAAMPAMRHCGNAAGISSVTQQCKPDIQRCPNARVSVGAVIWLNLVHNRWSPVLINTAIFIFPLINYPYVLTGVASWRTVT